MNRLKYIEVLGVIFTILLGTILHFTYKWSGDNQVVALFSPMNESIWEHLKMLFFPYMLYAILEYVYIGRNYPNFITAKCFGVICGLVLIPFVCTIYMSILGTSIVVVDIILFILAIVLSYVISYYIMMKKTLKANSICIVVTIVITVVFFLFTLYPPNSSLFYDPISHSYGINERKS